MKKLLFLTLVLSLGGVAQADPVRPLLAADRPVPTALFILEIDRALRGARVAVQHTNGDLVLIEKIRKRKMIIDFSAVQRGTYTIELRKGKARQLHAFTKN